MSEARELDDLEHDGPISTEFSKEVSLWIHTDEFKAYVDTVGQPLLDADQAEKMGTWLLEFAAWRRKKSG